MVEIILKGNMDNEMDFFYDLLPEGLQLVRILEAKQKKSSKGNDVLVTTIQSVETGARTTFWFPSAQGKRWKLDSLLKATGLYKKDEHGNDDGDTDKLIGAEVGAFIISEDSTYTTKDGHEVTRKRSIIKRFVKKEEIEKK